MQVNTFNFSRLLGVLPRVLNVAHVLSKPAHQFQQRFAQEAHISERRYHLGALVYHINDLLAFAVRDQRRCPDPQGLLLGPFAAYSLDMNARLPLYM